MDVVLRYAQSLAAVDSRLLIVSTNERISEQLAVNGITAVIGTDSIYAGDERVGASLEQAQRDATAWIATQGREP